MRSRNDFAEKPPNTTECGAPILAHASIAIAASGITPSFFKALAN